MKAKSNSRPGPAAKAQAVEFYNAETYASSESVGYLMRRVMTIVSQEIERELEPSGLTNAQWVPLFKLSLGSATTGVELARECELDAGAVTRLLDRLEAKGLCRRERSSEDRRVVNLELTNEGKQAVKVVPQVLSKVQNQLLDGFTVDEWKSLREFLRRILDNAKSLQARSDSQASKADTVLAGAPGTTK
jgi:DNA-binding MarR family transcriptional regulator